MDLDPLPPLGIQQLMPVLEKNRVRRAAILSNAYFFTSADENSKEAVQRRSTENDRIAEAASSHPERVAAFFSVNPLSDSALDVIRARSRQEAFSGLKLHLANSNLNLRDDSHVRDLAAVIALAGDLELPIVVHLRTAKNGYGAEEARVFINEVLSPAGKPTVQVAHMAGWGGFDKATDAALGVFATHSDKPALDNVYFDLSAVVRGAPQESKSKAASQRSELDERPDWYPGRRYQRLVYRMRSIGMDRVLFGTDWPDWEPRGYAKDLEKQLPLTDGELCTVLTNRAPWMR